MIAPVEEGTYVHASLIVILTYRYSCHDDVVDDASERERFLIIIALWKNKIAVLVGDFYCLKDCY